MSENEPGSPASAPEPEPGPAEQPHSQPPAQDQSRPAPQVPPAFAPGEAPMLYPVPGHYGYGYAVRPPYSGLAVASLVTGILSVLIMCWIPVSLFPAAGAVITGHIAMVKLKDPTVPRLGMGMAISGLVTGYVTLAVGVLLISAVIYSSVTS